MSSYCCILKSSRNSQSIEIVALFEYFDGACSVIIRGGWVTILDTFLEFLRRSSRRVLVGADFEHNEDM